MPETESNRKPEGEENVVVGQTFWDYARREDDDRNLATVTRYVAGREVPNMPTNLQILAEVLKNDGKRIRDCIAAKRERERAWKAAQRARREGSPKGLSGGQQQPSSGHDPMSTQPTGSKEERKEEQKEGKVKEETVKEESEFRLTAEPPRKPAKSAKDERHIIPPTLEMVRAYCHSRGDKVNPERFMAYWEARGWMMNPAKRQKMVDWQAAVRTFELNGFDGQRGAKRADGWRKPERDQRDGLEGV